MEKATQRYPIRRKPANDRDSTIEELKKLPEHPDKRQNYRIPYGPIQNKDRFILYTKRKDIYSTAKNKKIVI